MLSVDNIQQLRQHIRHWRQQGLTIAFVPTMGNLHQGHLELVRAALTHADKVVVSIFVNPMQFGVHEDLDAYPRTLAADYQALIQAGTDLLFTPQVETMYPKGLASQTFIEVPHLSDTLCGASRPGHFRGVATIVAKLFNLVQPDVALFGKKDFQQLQVIKTLVTDLCLPIDIIGIDTQRAESGLALSSRNGYLTPEQLALAPTLKRTIDELKLAILQGETITQATQAATAKLARVGFRPDYLAVCNASNLTPARPEDNALVILAAAYLGQTRLIDNIEFTRN
ncbi:pantoate--beta-alanine ligase [Shewanella sp. NIFS-20-20]|uniref:pantoate--beta-alanine ligase n=1 Tax=Shewanella sp. NIFS-20-20 TaxID=2853806 RepID=UPI001C46527A|nr:pantoate--beta-alanine ligase [Shewanella sp. NIFS-20-20]MBV7314130.1 pantoate--beta-alanine ligase [Shewanella sp. NIFS-20-20]